MSRVCKYSHYQQGFTLLEVMVALAILAVVAVSVSQVSRSYLNSVDNMKARSRAYFVAQNALADLRIQKKFPTSKETNVTENGAKQWQVTIAPQTTSNNNQLETLIPISVTVAPMDNGTAKSNLVTIDAVLAQSLGQN